MQVIYYFLKTQGYEIGTSICANDKLDLVRLEDSYGRKGLPYEDSSYENPKQDDCLWLENLSVYENKQIPFSNCKLTILNVKNITDLTCLESCVTKERPLAYEPITAGEYLDERLREIGLKK